MISTFYYPTVHLFKKHNFKGLVQNRKPLDCKNLKKKLFKTKLLHKTAFDIDCGVNGLGEGGLAA